MAKSNDTLLSDILRDHLSYEVGMLRATFTRLDHPVHDRVIGNALIESFCFHARILIEFLDNKKAVRASWFTDAEYAPFRAGRIDGPVTRKLNTQIAHLTLKRTSDDNQKIGSADRRELLEKLERAIQEFEDHLKPEFRRHWMAEPTKAFTLSVPEEGASATNAPSRVSSTNTTADLTMCNTISIQHGIGSQSHDDDG